MPARERGPRGFAYSTLTGDAGRVAGPWAEVGVLTCLLGQRAAVIALGVTLQPSDRSGAGDTGWRTYMIQSCARGPRPPMCEQCARHTQALPLLTQRSALCELGVDAAWNVNVRAIF